jgi:hypothetical protein
MSTVTAPAVVTAATVASTARRPHAPHVRRLGTYDASGGGPSREIVSLPRPDGSVLVVDRFSDTLTDARLVAGLAPDEPSENARIVCEMYLADETRGRCRLLSIDDSDANGQTHVDSPDGLAALQPLADPAGRLYRIRIVAPRDSTAELCWTRFPASDGDRFDVLTLRDVVAGVADYEPARTITAAALSAHRDDELVLTRRLAGELQRVTRSPIVLNRRLREAVQRKVLSNELTMSEIALRCGRTKRDRRGNLSGETSWLARRIGALPEGGEAEPTQWVHIDTLALIARDGLGLNPNEVEL